MKLLITVLICSISLHFLIAQPTVPYRYHQPEQLEDGIITGLLTEVGLDESIIHAFTDSVTKGVYSNIHSVLILRHQKLVYEEYWPGNDVIRGKGFVGFVDHHRDSLHDQRSVTKSVVSAAVMIAIGQGKIASVNQRVFDFFPEYAEQDTGMKQQITIKHLLNMSAGLEWDEEVPYTDPRNSEIQMNNAPDPIAFVLIQPLLHSPGKKYTYSGGCSQILAAIVKKATGTPVDKFTEQYLFNPLGIENYTWVKTSAGDPSAASGLRLRSRDMAKFGLLYMNKGKWKGRQIIQSRFVRKTLKSQISTSYEYPGVSHIGYSNQFWIPTEIIQGKRVTFGQCQGNGGQLIALDKQNDLVLVITAGNYNQGDLNKTAWDIYPDAIYPAARKKG